MTDGRRELWRQYFQHIAEKQGLRDWAIRLPDDVPDNPDAMADVQPVWGKKVANVRLCKDWEGFSPEEQRKAVVHELVHPHFEQPEQWVLEIVNERLAKHEAQWLFDHYKYLVEFGVDAIAAVLMDYMPLPADVIPELGKAA